MTFNRLQKLLNDGITVKEFFLLLFEYVDKDHRYSVEGNKEVPRRVVFFGSDFNVKTARLILNHERAKEFFGPIEELRIVATLIPKEEAKQFKTLNPDMRLFWVSNEEWLARPVGGTNPVTLTDPPGGEEL